MNEYTRGRIPTQGTGVILIDELRGPISERGIVQGFRHAGEAELRKLAAIRDEAGAAWWFFLWAELPNAATGHKED